MTRVSPESISKLEVAVVISLGAGNRRGHADDYVVGSS